MLNYKVEKVPSLRCEKCNSTHVIMTDSGPECDDCDRITVWVEEKELENLERCDSIRHTKSLRRQNEAV